MSDAVIVTPPGALERLSDTLTHLREISGRTSESILATKGGQFLFGNDNPKYGTTFRGLYALFAAEKPRDNQIFAAAKQRGFRVGGRAFDGRLRPTAILRAREMMGGYKSILVNTREDGSGLTFVRAGTARKAKRVHFRRGRLSYAVSSTGYYDKGAGFSRSPGDKVVNLRAVATFFELQIREGGRGFLAAAWLQKRWRKFAKEGFVPEGTPGLRPGFTKSRQFGGTERRLVNMNPRSTVKLLGDAEFLGQQDSGNISLRISSYVPGTKEIGEGRGLFAKVIAAVTTDTEQYIARKQTEAIIAGLGFSK